MKLDVFISHASEDKRYFVRDFAKKLMSRGVSVWYDEYSLRLGDGLRESIDQGLAESRFGIVVLSENFFRKNWTQAELEGIFTLDFASNRQFMIPLWHKVGPTEVRKYSPMLAGRVSKDTRTKHLDELVIREIRPDLSQEVEDRANPSSFRGYLSSNSYFSKAEMDVAELTTYLMQHDPSINWAEYAADAVICHKMAGLKYTSGLQVIFEDKFCNEVLESMYRRILGRPMDQVGRVTYLPLIFLRGRQGVQQIEDSMRSSIEYRNLAAKELD